MKKRVRVFSTRDQITEAASYTRAVNRRKGEHQKEVKKARRKNRGETINGQDTSNSALVQEEVELAPTHAHA
jgi:hypothetical protein